MKKESILNEEAIEEYHQHEMIDDVIDSEIASNSEDESAMDLSENDDCSEDEITDDDDDE